MKLRVLGWKVLVAPIDLEEDAAMSDYLKEVGFKIKAGLDANDDRRAKVALECGRIEQIGPNAFKNKDWGYVAGLWGFFLRLFGKSDFAPPQIGQKVWFGKYAGKLIMDPDDKLEYMLLNDEDIQCIVD